MLDAIEGVRRVQIPDAIAWSILIVRVVGLGLEAAIEVDIERIPVPGVVIIGCKCCGIADTALHHGPHLVGASAGIGVDIVGRQVDVACDIGRNIDLHPLYVTLVTILIQRVTLQFAGFVSSHFRELVLQHAQCGLVHIDVATHHHVVHAVDVARELYEYLGVPVLTSWNGMDLIEDAHPLFYGRPGIVGHRAENFIQQQADFILTLGSRLCLLNSGYNYDGFLKNAHHVMVDIDAAEMEKKSVHPEVKAVCDVGDFIRKLLLRKKELDVSRRSAWIAHCDKLYEQFPAFIPEQDCRPGYVSNYHLARAVSDALTGNDIYQFTSSGTTVDITMKSFQVKKGQRSFLTKGLAAMGYDIPASIGSCIASGGKRVACITGDGSAAMNMQELEVIHRLNLPVKLFISDNSGYSMIYGSQNGNFKGRLSGCTKESGLTIPDFFRLAEAFGIKAMQIDSENDLKEKVSEVLSFDGPVVCTVKTDITQKIVPRQCNYMKEDGQMASRPLEDMAPLLDRDVFEKAMQVED